MHKLISRACGASSGAHCSCEWQEAKDLFKLSQYWGGVGRGGGTLHMLHAAHMHLNSHHLPKVGPPMALGRNGPALSIPSKP